MNVRVMRLYLLIAVLLIPFRSSVWGKDDLDTNMESPSHEPSSVYIAIIGDIQYYTNPTYIGIYQHSLNWIQQKSEEGWHFNCILQTGDITQNNRSSQYDCFYQATYPISQNIPYVTMIGDHDYTWDGPLINDRHSTLFNEYVQFPLTTEKIVAWFEEGRMENIVVENTIHGQRLDLLVLEFGPREEVVAWANDYVKAHANQNFILMNHEYLEKGGGRRTYDLKCHRLLNTSYVEPNELWNKLIRCNDNIRLVLCGHVGGLYALTIDTNDFGREVPQIQHNIQSSDYRFDNWVMFWEFPVDSYTANVFIYNTKTEKYYEDKSILFQFRYRDEKPTGIRRVRQNLMHSTPANNEMYRADGIRFPYRRGKRGIVIKNNVKRYLKDS